MGNISDNKYAKGIVSLQISANSDDTPCHVLIVNPRRPKGYCWPGGYFFPSGDLKKSAMEASFLETGIPLKPESVHLKEIIYSRTLEHEYWVANYRFTAQAKSREFWKEPTNPKYQVFLAETASLNSTPRILGKINGNSTDKFNWSVTDGEFIAQRVYREFILKLQGREYNLPIPIVKVPTDGDSKFGYGHGLNVSQIILPHMFKGRNGFVMIENHDSRHYALIGGKVESPSSRESRNLDIVSCIVAEGKEEIGVDLQGIAVVGCALTPLDALPQRVAPEVKAILQGPNSILTTAILTRPLNPQQLDEAIRNPERYITEKDKIRGIYFVPDDEYHSIIQEGNMRTPDMVELSLLYLNGTPAERPTLESIVVLN